MHRSAKLLASLICIGKRIPALSSFLEHASAEPELAELLGKDIDNSSNITDRWYTQLTTHFANRQLKLTPRAN